MNMKVPLFDIPDKVIESLDVVSILYTANDMAKMSINDPPFEEFSIRISMMSTVHIAYEIAKTFPEDPRALNFSKEKIMERAIEKNGRRILIIDYCNFDKRPERLGFETLCDTYVDGRRISWQLFSEMNAKTIDNMCVIVYKILTVLLATRNIDRKVVINSARSGSKRARDDAKSYSSTTYLNIGKITETCRGGSSGSKSGGPTRPHLRRGHIRLQRYGEGLKESKQIFIQPTFVNADKEWIDRQKTYKFTGSHDASASSGLTASRETRKREIVDHVG